VISNIYCLVLFFIVIMGFLLSILNLFFSFLFSCGVCEYKKLDTGDPSLSRSVLYTSRQEDSL